MTSGKVAQLASQLASLAAPVVLPVVRRLPAVVLALAVTITALGLVALVSARWDDAAIDAHRGVAVAEVLDGSGGNQTLVRFSTTDGRVVTPEAGAFYPNAQRPGDKVLVEYDQRAPERVRIAGRSSAVGIGSVALGVVVVWLVALPLAAWLRRQPFTGHAERASAAGTTSG